MSTREDSLDDDLDLDLDLGLGCRTLGTFDSMCTTLCLGLDIGDGEAAGVLCAVAELTVIFGMLFSITTSCDLGDFGLGSGVLGELASEAADCGRLADVTLGMFDSTITTLPGLGVVLGTFDSTTCPESLLDEPGRALMYDVRGLTSVPLSLLEDCTRLFRGAL